MLKAAWKSVLGHKARLLLSTVAIVLGIAFLSAVLSFNNMINSAVDGIVSGGTADVNVVTKGTFDSSNRSGMPIPGEITQADIDKIAKVDGVAAAVGTVQLDGAYPLSKQGKVIGTIGAPAMAFNFFTAKAYHDQPGLVLKQGRGPENAGEVAVDPVTLERGGYAVGDTIKIAFSGPLGTMEKRIVGVATWGSGGSAGATYVFFDTKTMQDYALDGRPVYQACWVQAKPGTDLKDLAQRITANGLPAGFEAVDGKTASDVTSKNVKDSLGFITNFLLVFAAVGLVVAVFLIVNTFTILVAQRGRELALYRALGASRGQVTRSVLLEALVVGVVGSLLGAVAGWGLALILSALLKSMGSDFGSAAAVLSLPGLGICLVVGTLTTLVAALMPARRAGRVPPVAAMSGDAMTGKQGLGARAVVGVLLAAVGAAALLCGLWLHVPQRLWWVGLGALFTLVGVSLASPILGWPVIKLFELIYAGVFRTVGRLAAMNATRNPRRTAATASALMIGVTLVSTFAILGNSAERMMHRDIASGVHADVIVSTRSQQGWSDETTQKMKDTPGVERLSTYAFTAVFDADHKPLNLTVMSEGSFGKDLDQVIREGREPTAAGEVIVSQQEAADKGWHVGQRLDTMSTAAKPLPLTIVGVFETTARGFSLGNVMTLPSTVTDIRPRVAPAIAFITAAPGQDVAHLVTTLTDNTLDDPLLQVQSMADFTKSMTAQVDQILAMLYALLGVAVVIAIFGIVNTLVLSILERRREIGLLRAVGLQRGQLRLMVGLESVVIAVLGAVLGIGMGLLFGWALATTAINADSFAIPWDQLLVFLGLSIVVGILAGIVPAVAASRMHTLRAIASD